MQAFRLGGDQFACDFQVLSKALERSLWLIGSDAKAHFEFKQIFFAADDKGRPLEGR